MSDAIDSSPTNAIQPAGYVADALQCHPPRRAFLIHRAIALGRPEANTRLPLLVALVAEHAPQGPTEEHLVEERPGSCGESDD